MAVTDETVMDEIGNSSDEVDWTPENEVHLFYAMRGHKPVGVGKYFQMACIVEKFRNFANKDVTSKPLWEHLESMYDIQSLDDIESMPFPNEESEFSLPEEEYGSLIQERVTGEQVQAEAAEEVKPIKEVATPVKEAKSSPVKKEVKEVKESIKEVKKEPKEPKKSVGKEVKRDVKEPKKTVVKEVKEGKEEPKEPKEPRTPKQRGGARESGDGKRGVKRSVRGGGKSDEPSSPATAPMPTPPPPPPPPPQKRRRT